MFRVLGIERDRTACNYYRILQPLHKLKEHKMADVVIVSESESAYNLDYIYQKVMESDLVVFQRPASEEWLKFIRVAQQAGKIIVADYDDDPFRVNPINPSYRWSGTEEVVYQWEDGNTDMMWKDGESGFDIERNIRHVDLFKASFRKADLITVTTPILQESLIKINPNCVVLPNLVDFNIYPQCDFVKKGVRILWQGGSSHYEDLYIVHKAIIDILKKHKDATFVYFGDVRFMALFKNAPQEQMEYHSWVAHQTYPFKLVTMNADIGLCPIADNQFNRKKSSIKWMEYSIIKLATIASNIPPYSVDITDGQDGLLVSEDGWFDAMDKLITDKQYRLNMANRAYDTVFEKHNADKFAYLWRDAYEKVLKREIVEV